MRKTAFAFLACIAAASHPFVGENSGKSSIRRESGVSSHKLNSHSESTTTHFKRRRLATRPTDHSTHSSRTVSLVRATSRSYLRRESTNHSSPRNGNRSCFRRIETRWQASTDCRHHSRRSLTVENSDSSTQERSRWVRPMQRRKRSLRKSMLYLIRDQIGS